MAFKDKKPSLEDSLLECLVVLSKIANDPISKESLTTGFPIKKGESSPELFSSHHLESGFERVAKRAGFISKLVKRDLTEISKFTLPCILLLKNSQSCILLDFDKENNQAKIISPEFGEAEIIVGIEKIEKEYLGYAYYLKKEFQYNQKQHDKKAEDEQHWFWGSIKRFKKIYFEVLLASLFINIFVLAVPLFTMNVYDRVVPNNAIDTLWVLGVGVIVVLLLDFILKYTRTYFLEIAAKKGDIIISSKIFEKVMHLKMSSKPKSVGSFANSLKEFESIRAFFTSSTIAVIVDLPFILIFLSVVFFLGSSIVLVPAFIILLLVGYAFVVKKPLQKSIESTFEASAQKNSILIESLSGFETIKTLGTQGYHQYIWEEACGDIANKSLKSRLISNSITSLSSFLIQLNSVLVVIYGVYLISDAELSMGGLIAVLILSSRAISPMGQVASLLANYEHTKTAYLTLNDIMNLADDREKDRKFLYRPNFEGLIEFKNVTFTYPGEIRPALENLSFHINKGEKVGIIGKTGSGKTTIEKLIIGLYPPDNGSIMIDGIDINQINPADLRKNIGYIPQDIYLFKGTLKENIAYKTPHCSDETILKASKISQLLEFVNRHPKGFAMDVGERGEGLSGGQKQSIAIARAFIADSVIMLMDEPSNAMDNTTEVKLISSLKEDLKEKTTVLITHKTSMLSLIDRLIVVDNGKIVLDGKKEEVLKRLTNA